VAVRLERQTILTREMPVQLFAVLDATVLGRLIGTPAIMREQLDLRRPTAVASAR